MDKINLINHPGLIVLLEDGETIEDLMRLKPEQILLRWINYQLRKVSFGNIDATFQNFSKRLQTI